MTLTFFLEAPLLHGHDHLERRIVTQQMFDGLLVMRPHSFQFCTNRNK
ncbi:unnamed protein product [Nezara viridula]|uniref:Uncharacterized protein n=1 Tax=Nezara viridula TaxID=85310 RepID=A0A9P0MQY7_NEZVI|nr:unnamed protein product [Nezara viridula]